jgi:dolichyl-diphosphooligosaccharide--protein glycosyltransferase
VNIISLAYTLWYIIGTFGATRVPVVGLTPFKSLEQLAPFALFIVFQLRHYCQRRKYLFFYTENTLIHRHTHTHTHTHTYTLLYSLFSVSLGIQQGSKADIKFKLFVFAFASVVIGAIVYVLLPTGYFGPLSARVRGLFVQV